MHLLADGQLSPTRTVIFTATTQFGAKLERITFFNDSDVSQTVILYLTRHNRLPRKVRRYVLEQDETGIYLEPGEQLDLANGDQIEVESTSANAVDYTVIGKLI